LERGITCPPVISSTSVIENYVNAGHVKGGENGDALISTNIQPKVATKLAISWLHTVID
jgi:hypothetical protein